MLILQILLNAALLMILIKAFTDEDVGLGSSAVVGFLASIATAGLTLGIAQVVPGILALIIAGVVVAAILGVVVSAMYGIEIKRSMLVGMLYVVGYIIISVVLQMILKRGME